MRKKKILIAEDDNDILYILNTILTDAGYTVQSLAEGSAIVEGKLDLPDLFILDKVMPLIDGLAICKYLKIKNDTKNIPVIMISAYHKLKQKAKKAGVDHFIEKPFDIGNLLASIETFVPRGDVLTAKENNNMPLHL
jgi:two-component system alkaline phosphatase synthesis response regulator PhoP